MTVFFDKRRENKKSYLRRVGMNQVVMSRSEQREQKR